MTTKTLTGNKDVDLIILSKLEDKDLLSMCLTSKYADNLCKTDSIWIDRLVNKYGRNVLKYKDQNKTYKRYYLQLIYYLNLDINYGLYGASALFKAAKDGQKDICQAMIELFGYDGLDINYGLYGASASNNKNLVDFFIDEGAQNLDIALNFAARYGNKDMVLYLIKKGARNFASSGSEARDHGHPELAAYLHSLALEHMIR